jgi:phage tail sheath protein FI
MPVFLSPGVFVNEIDLSVLPANTSTIIPAFIGTAQKGPLNTPTFISTAQQFIDQFGDPTPEANLGYAVIAYLEEGNAIWVLRVGVECEEGQVTELSDICIDTSGARVEGWGRVPVFQGIDFGRINLRIPTVDAPLTFHDDLVFNVSYTDLDVSTTDGPTSATVVFVGSALSATYIGSIDDSFTVLITSSPTSGVLGGAGYQIIRNSDGVVVGSGTLVESSPGVSAPVAVGSGTDDSGLILRVEVTGTSPIEQDDSFSFEVRPDNRTLSIEVEGAPSVPATFTLGAASYTTPAAFVAAFNALVGTSVDFLAGYDGTNLFVRTVVAGRRIQITGTEAFALEVGVAKWALDIPRSWLVGVDTGPYNINSNNNQVFIDLIETDVTTNLTATVSVSLTATPDSVAVGLNLGGVQSGDRFYESVAIQVTDDDKRVYVIASAAHQFGQLRILNDFSHIRTLRFAEELNINVSTRAYRTFSDPRVSLPESGIVTPSTPLSCETNPAGAQCALDTAYYSNIVGWFVAPSPGTWLNGYTLTLNTTIEPGRFVVQVFDPSGLEVNDARADDISFDSTDTRYIGNVVNPQSPIGGQNGNPWVNWEDRPVFLENDPNDVSNFAVRQPGVINREAFVGMANGIPLDALFASELDRAIIGNPARSTGINAFQNPETFDITLLATPGFSSGAVIAEAISMCERRGDCLYIVDPPFGLRPQQVVDWHNGMLFSDLSASLNSSYGALYWSWIEIFDQFNGGTIFVPPSGHIAAVYARTARVAEPWFAPAGLNRGRLLTALDLEFSPTQGERDLLYGFNNAVNPLVNFPQDGITVFGQRTLQRADTALDRVNVRMLLIFIKKGLIPLLRNFLFEPNDRILWSQVKGATDPFLSDIKARRGITAFKVVVDETNNTPIRRDRNELWVSVFIKPTRAVEFIVLNLVILRTDASFTADEVLAAAGIVVENEFA